MQIGTFMLLRPRFARAGVTQLTSSRGFRCPMTVPSSLKPATSIPANAVSRKMSSSPDWNTIKAVVFDAYGTLFNVNSAASAMKDDIGQNWQQLSELWRQKQLSYTWLRSLMPEYVDFEELTSKALDHALETYKLHEKPDLKKKLMDLYMKLEAYPEVPLTLASLRSKGLQTAILSNGSPKMLNAAVNSAGIKHLLDAVLSVDTVQVFKPFPTVYALVPDHFSLRKDEILFVSSNCWDVHGASHYGFKVFWCNRAGHVDDYGLPGKADHVGKNLEGIKELFGV